MDQIIYAYNLMLDLHVFRQIWPPRRVDCLALTTCLPHKGGGIPLIALPKGTTSKLAGLFSKDKIFGTKIRQLFKNKEFIETMSSVEKNGWITFSQVVNNFLGNTKSAEYKEIVKILLDTFHKLGCNMSVNVHFLRSHLEYFPENLGALSEEQGESFTKTLKSWRRDTKVDGTLT